ncbi:hypothetical protein IJG91_00720 [Candidatus Saccharibacteria bacterium]|nr:hypothetical protein [Candidatus Saccharibacteria bacterium]
MEKFDYYEKIENLKKYQELSWNIPEQKNGKISLIGGNSQSFSNIIKSAESLQQSFPIKDLSIILPDSLKNKLPPLPNFVFASSTESGSFAKSDILDNALKNSDFNILLGDFSKNSATCIAIAEALKSSDNPTIFARDTIDLLLPEMVNIIEKENLFIIGTMAQLQKLFRAVYYPKMLLLSMPLMQVVENLHKFTLSYPCTILTFLENQVIIANNGKVAGIPIGSTSYTPLSLWDGELAGKIAAMNLFNPGKPLEATISGLIS